MTDLTPEAANVVHTATSSGQTAADSGLKPVLKLPFVELGDRYGIKPEALAIVGQGHDLTFINDLQSVHPMNVNGGLEADSMVPLGQANISLVAGTSKGADWTGAMHWTGTWWPTMEAACCLWTRRGLRRSCSKTMLAAMTWKA